MTTSIFQIFFALLILQSSSAFAGATVSTAVKSIATTHTQPPVHESKSPIPEPLVIKHTSDAIEKTLATLPAFMNFPPGLLPIITSYVVPPKPEYQLATLMEFVLILNDGRLYVVDGKLDGEQKCIFANPIDWRPSDRSDIIEIRSDSESNVTLRSNTNRVYVVKAPDDLAKPAEIKFPVEADPSDSKTELKITQMWSTRNIMMFWLSNGQVIARLEWFLETCPDWLNCRKPLGRRKEYEPHFFSLSPEWADCRPISNGENIAAFLCGKTFSIIAPQTVSGLAGSSLLTSPRFDPKWGTPTQVSQLQDTTYIVFDGGVLASRDNKTMLSGVDAGFARLDNYFAKPKSAPNTHSFNPQRHQMGGLAVVDEEGKVYTDGLFRFNTSGLSEPKWFKLPAHADKVHLHKADALFVVTEDRKIWSHVFFGYSHPFSKDQHVEVRFKQPTKT